MHINEEKINKQFFYWLLTSFVLVYSIILVGGLTRLTNSGLSITEWELVGGILPPLNSSSWENYFNKYKLIPQYKILNFNMNLDEFKIIFYWEYLHRILARIIGLFFFIPIIYFYFTNKINKKYLKICLLIFLLILFQGIVGWYMVKSGLINDITVSHYRLSLHLGVAIIILSSIFWLLNNIYNKKEIIFFQYSKKYFSTQFLILLIFVQIVIGAFVSGLDAGNIYQTWPMMGNSYFPNDSNFNSFFNLFELDNHSLVQFYHRNLAYVIIIYTMILSIIIFKNKKTTLYKPLKILIFVLLLQVLIGILTLISGLNIYLASGHQILGVLLILSALNLYFFQAK